MVTTMPLHELMNLHDQAEQDKALRRAFAPYTPDIELEGEEYRALVVLVNLTLKRDQAVDLCDESQAQRLVNDDKHLEHCVHQVAWLHSHNLKYPDTRVSGQRLVIDAPPLIPGVVTSAGLQNRLGWANNSAEINYAKLFCSSFLYQGLSSNLAQQLVADVPAWTGAFRQLGVANTAISALQAQLAHHLAATAIPLEVSVYSKQVRFWYQGDYCAITPVASHALMAHLQHMIYENRCSHLTISHDHPASGGSLVGSVGGKVAVLNYPPPISIQKRRHFSQSRTQRLNEGRSLFDRGMLYDKVFPQALEHLITPTGLTRRQRKQSRLSSMRYLRRQLAAWIGPVIEWRDEIQLLPNVELPITPERLEWKIVTSPVTELPDLATELAGVFHLELQTHQATRRFAYHPELLVPVKSQLRWLLNKLASDENQPASLHAATSCYLHLSGLRVYDALALANPYLCGIPSLSALAGFCHDYERRLTALLKRPVRFTGVSWYLSHYHLLSGKLLQEPLSPIHAREVSAIRRPGLIDSKYCDLGMDLVIALQVDDEHPLPSANEQDLLQAAFPSRFAGGCLHPPSLYESKPWCSLYTNRNELFNTLSRLPRTGCWVYPCQSRISNLDELIDTLSMDRRVRPVSTGYVFLDEPRVRAGSVEKCHVYAESALGLALCLNPVEMRLAGTNHFFNHGFWQLTALNRAILMTGAGNMEQRHGAMQTSEL